MGRARLNKGTKKRVITSVERQIVCFSLGRPIKRNVPRTKGEVFPISIAKLRISETNTNRNRENFSFHQNSFERYANTSRRLTPKTRLQSRKNRDLLNKTPLLYSPTPHPATLPTLHPSSAPLRAPTRTQRIFIFCLHPSPTTVSPSFLAS